MILDMGKATVWRRAGLRFLGAGLGLAIVSCSSQEAPKPARPPVPVIVATATRGNAPILISEIGNVEAYSSVIVRPRAGGHILKASFAEGDEVRRDQLLFEIDPAPYEAVLRKAQADLLRDQALANNAEVEARRYEELVKKDYVTRRQADEARAHAEALQATLKADQAAVEEAELNLGYCSVRSPLDGRTGELITHPGNVVRANETALVTIQQVSPIYVGFAVPEARLPEIRRAQASGHLTVQAELPGSGPVPEKGKLCFVDSQVSPGTGTILLKAVFENTRKTLWPGQFVNVALTLGVRQNLVMTPTEAIQSGQKGPYVYVVTPDLVAQQRLVVLGAAFEQLTIIEKGLEAGEKVVTDGHLRLANGAKVQLKSQ